MEAVLYQNRSIVERIAKENRISQEDAERWLRGALQFLEVASVAEAPVSPSRKIDEAWHAFILHTLDYAEFCEERFGYYMHHQPTSEGVDNLSNYLRAREIAEERFGDLDEEVWPVRPEEVAAGRCTGKKGELVHAGAECRAECCSNPGTCCGPRPGECRPVRRN